MLDLVEELAEPARAELPGPLAPWPAIYLNRPRVTVASVLVVAGEEQVPAFTGHLMPERPVGLQVADDQARRLDVMGQRIQVNEEYRQNCIEAMQGLVSLL